MGTRRSKEDDWTEVTRKNRGYRTKEDDLVKVHSNADLTRTISKSIFVKNFPDNTTSADLWNISQTYGVVVDVYIPNHRSKQSQPPPLTRPGKIAPSFVSAVKGILPTPVLSPPAMVLDDSCMVTTDLRNYVMGEVKLFSSINNLRVILSAEGFSIQKVVYLGGLWVMFELPSANSKSKFLAHVGVGSWFKSLSNPQPDFSPRDRIIWVDVEGVPMHAWSSNTFHKIGSMWGEVLELGDCKDECFARKRLCIKTNRDDNILEKFKIIVKGKKQLTLCGVLVPNNVDDQFSTGSIENIQKKKESGSILEILEEMISVGQTMGFSMEGSIKDMERIIDLKGADKTRTMTCLSLNISRAWFTKGKKKDWIRELCNKNKVYFFSIRRHRLKKYRTWRAEPLGYTNFDAIVSQSLGSSELLKTIS
ncbi:RNA-directed DNA polymerase, eukaryota [Tanacetum coccineum]